MRTRNAQTKSVSKKGRTCSTRRPSRLDGAGAERASLDREEESHRPDVSS